MAQHSSLAALLLTLMPWAAHAAAPAEATPRSAAQSVRALGNQSMRYRRDVVKRADKARLRITSEQARATTRSIRAGALDTNEDLRALQHYAGVQGLGRNQGLFLGSTSYDYGTKGLVVTPRGLRGYNQPPQTGSAIVSKLQPGHLVGSSHMTIESVERTLAWATKAISEGRHLPVVRTTVHDPVSHIENWVSNLR